MKFCTRVRLKLSNHRGEFDLDRAKSKIDIAENSFALGHETHNTYLFIYFGRCCLRCENMTFIYMYVPYTSFFYHCQLHECVCIVN